MKNKRLYFALVAGLMIGSSVHAADDGSLTKFPKGKTPEEIGKRVVDNLLGRKHMLTTFLRNKKPGSIHYAEIVTAYGALGFADLTNDRDMLMQLELRYRPIVDEENSAFIPKGFHGDFTVFAMVPLELYRLRGDKRFYNLGMDMVDLQWKDPNPEDGLTWQARWWIDDAYMIAAVDALATRVTGDETYVNNSALLLHAYCSKLQHDNGLLPHTIGVPHYWGRGIGWVAAGLVEALVEMNEDHPLYDDIMGYYTKLMAGLLPLQAESGLWRQLVDDEEAWEETSCTGMFTYAYIVGIKKGWLDAKEYGPAARKGWLALTDNINENGDVLDVCVGTNEMKGRDAYLGRKRRVGDFHGQAPVLWAANALLRDY